MNENIIVKEYEFDNPLIQNIDSIINKCWRECYNKYFHTFEYICEYNLNFTKPNNEKVDLTISDKSIGLYGLNKKLTVARQNGYIFNQINSFKIKIYSNLSNINIHYLLKLKGIPLHCRFFKMLSRNRVYIQTHCNDINNPFHFACRQWYSFNNPGIHT